MLPLLSIKSLSIQFPSEDGPVHALTNVSLEVKKGEVVAIVGESGSGKTLTSLSILQLLPPEAHISSGNIIFHNKQGKDIDLLKADQWEMRNTRGNEIAMVFQEPMSSLNPVITCGEQVTEAIMAHQQKSRKQATAETIDLFEKVNLPTPAALYHRYPHQLSGGQKQRVMIAMAVSCKPSLLIADEPTTALDVTVQQTVLRQLKELQQLYGMAVIYISHDLNLVAKIADRIVVMYKGGIVEEGTTREIFMAAKHPYTQALLACRPSAGSKGKRLALVSDFMGGVLPTTEIKHVSAPNDVPGKELIRVSDLVVSFKQRGRLLGKKGISTVAVDHVSFPVYEGEVLGVVGESGSGKTTLGRALLKLVPATSGCVVYNGKEITALTETQMRLLREEMQIVFQDPYGSLNPRITIGNAIAEPLQVHNLGHNPTERRVKVNELLEKVQLKPEHFNRYPHQFSGGQRQRISIARALAVDPGFIIFDESVSALDVSVQAQVLNLINDLKKEFGFTCLFISHDLNVVRYISDRIMVMEKGKIVETGTADDVYYRPQHPYTQKLIASIPKGFEGGHPAIQD